MAFESVSKIVSIVKGPGKTASDAVDWTEIERQIGVRLPGDFKQLSEGVGRGRFGGGLYLRSPWSEHPADGLNLIGLREYHSLYKDGLWDFGFRSYPEVPGLFNIASVDEVGLFYEMNGSGDCGNIVRMFDFECEVHEETGSSISDLILSMYERTVRSPWLQFLNEWQEDHGFFAPMQEQSEQSRPDISNPWDINP